MSIYIYMTRVVVVAVVVAVNKTLFTLKKITSVNLPSDWDFRSFLLLLFFFSRGFGTFFMERKIKRKGSPKTST